MDIAQPPQRSRHRYTSCIGAPLHVVKYMDGWANSNSVIEGRPHHDPISNGWQHFGWLVAARPLHLD
jgi:hypothetical protein